MAVQIATFIRDTLYFIKNDLSGNITDPISTTRTGASSFVMTSYPKKDVQYPLVTLKMINWESKRAGMQTTALDITATIEIRVWARNEKEKDTLFNSIIDRLRSIQFTASTGSSANELHDFEHISSVEVDEPGEQGIKSRIAQIKYKFFNVS